MKWLMAAASGVIAFWITQQLQMRWRQRELRQQWQPIFPAHTIPPSLIWRIHREAIEEISDHLKKRECPAPLRFLQSWLVGAGLDASAAWHDLVAFQILLGAEMGLVGALWGIGLPLLLVGLGYPLFWLRSLQKERLQTIQYELPSVIDLLALSVEAGLDLLPALQRIVGFMPQSLLALELQRMLAEISLGLTRAEALERFSRRVPLLSVKSLTVHLVQTIKLGSPVAPILAAQAKRLREMRLQAAEKAGIYAAQKMLFPLVFCIIPAVFIIILGPVLLHWFYGGLGGLL